jgi:hypothetical protein
MLNKITTLIFCLSLAIFTACSGDTDTGANKAATDSKDLPEGISTKPVQPDGKTTPGIPDPKTINTNSVPKGATPTPGIPDPKTIGKTPVPKGATPTPGIPSPDELKKQRDRKVDPNEVNKPSKTSSTGETTSPIDRQRKVKN